MSRMQAREPVARPAHRESTGSADRKLAGDIATATRMQLIKAHVSTTERYIHPQEEANHRCLRRSGENSLYKIHYS